MLGHDNLALQLIPSFAISELSESYILNIANLGNPRLSPG